MKARVIATGEIGIVANIDLLFGCKGYRYQSDEVEIIDSYAEIEADADSDYWTRLEHQAGIAAMQGLILTASKHMGTDQEVAQWACECAHALVEKMKESV